MVLQLPPPKQHGKGNALLGFLPDSPEQIAESMDKMALRDKLHQAVQAAIARANVSQQNSNHPAIDQTVEEVDSTDEAAPK